MSHLVLFRAGPNASFLSGSPSWLVSPCMRLLIVRATLGTQSVFWQALLRTSNFYRTPSALRKALAFGMQRSAEMAGTALASDYGESVAKRQRTESPGPGPSSSDAGLAQAGQGFVAGQDPLDGVPDAPFHLMRVRDIPAWANEGFLGVKLADLVRGRMKWVLVSNYMVDFGWLLSACPDLQRAERVVVVHGESGVTAANIVSDVHSAGMQDRTTIFSPPLPLTYGTHHSKAFLIHYERGLRVVIHTANLIYPDCNNKSQGIWWQDFPLKDGQSPKTSDFERDLATYLSALSIPPSAAKAARDALAAHDFSAARGRLVGSVPGYHKGNQMHLWGHMRVRACLSREEFPASFAGAPLAAQFSSLGSLDEGWLGGEFKSSFSQGRLNGGQRLEPQCATGPAGLQLVWPTVKEVQNSIEGWMAGRSIPGPEKNVSKPFLQQYWHRWGGEPTGRQRAMPHIKSYVRYAAAGDELAWMLVGSHNLSKAAWGQLQKKGSQLCIRSYELGVLMVPSLERVYRQSRWRGFSCTSSVPAPAPGDAVDELRFVRWHRGMPQEASAAVGGQLKVPVPIPFPLAPTRYTQGDTPWMVDHPRPGVDTFGRTFVNPHGRFYGLLEQMQWDSIP